MKAGLRGKKQYTLRACTKARTLHTAHSPGVFFAQPCFEGNVRAFLYRARAQHVYLALLVLKPNFVIAKKWQKNGEEAGGGVTLVL